MIADALAAVQQPADQLVAVAGEAGLVAGEREGGERQSRRDDQKEKDVDGAAGPVDEARFALIRQDGVKHRPHRTRGEVGDDVRRDQRQRDGQRQVGPVGRHAAITRRCASESARGCPFVCRAG